MTRSGSVTGRCDFTRALYLGLGHPSRMLGSWQHLTSGRPEVLQDKPEQSGVAGALAALVGCERGVVSRSTLHLIWDVFGIWGRERRMLCVDSGVYPITRWGIQRAKQLGAVVRYFTHHSVKSLRCALRSAVRFPHPVVVTDGWCPRCGRAAPLSDYLRTTRRYGGVLMVDDTQALGILGCREGTESSPYGLGGGGLTQWFGLSGPDLVVVASLAKAFGAPLASLASNAAFVRRVEQQGETRVHTSPVSTADVRAAEHALSVNALHGETLRRRLARRVCRFRDGLARLGLAATGGWFPVQSLSRSTGIDPYVLFQRVRRCGLNCVLLREDALHALQIAWLLTASHPLECVDAAVRIVERCLDPRPSAPSKGATKCPATVVKHDLF